MCKEDCRFEVGQKVFDLQFGEGKVIGMSNLGRGPGPYPVLVNFSGSAGNKAYTYGGSFTAGRGRTLFFAMPKITEDCLNPPLPPRHLFSPGDIVEVDANTCSSQALYVMEDDGATFVVLFTNGRKSGSTTCCHHSRLTLIKAADQK